MKKLFLLLAVGGSLSVNAVENVENVEKKQERCDISGFNVGIDLAQTWTVARNYSDYDYYIAGGARTEDRDISLYKSKKVRLAPGINLGYSHKYNCGAWVGLSGEMMFSNSKERVADDLLNAGSVINTKFHGTSYALKFKGGYHFDKNVLYAIVGVRWQNAEFKEAGDFNFSKVQPKNGMPVLGIGLERKLCSNLTFDVEYEHFWRKSSSVSTAGDPTGDGNQPTWTEFKVYWQPSVRGNSIRIGLKYYPKW